jgi:hypothetical protein
MLNNVGSFLLTRHSDGDIVSQQHPVVVHLNIYNAWQTRTKPGGKSEWFDAQAPLSYSKSTDEATDTNKLTLSYTISNPSSVTLSIIQHQLQQWTPPNLVPWMS